MSSAPPNSLPKAPRIKRKPPPRLDVSERYPPPDPNDPFAPLSALRSRSSALLGLPPSQDNLVQISAPYRRTSFLLEPDPSSPTELDDLFLRTPAGSEYDAYVDVATPLKSPSSKPVREAHYRRRSQSIIPIPTAQYTATLPHSFEPTPSLIRDQSGDSGTDVEYDSVRRRTRSISPHQPSDTSRGRARFLSPRKKASKLSIKSSWSFSISNSEKQDKVPQSASLSTFHKSRVSSSSPVSHKKTPSTNSGNLSKLNHKNCSSTAISSLNHFRQPSDNSSDDFYVSSRENDLGYYSQPETTSHQPQPLSASHRLARQALGSSTTKCIVIPNVHILPSTPTAFHLASSVPEAHPFANRSENSCQSSYVDVSVPSSVAGHDAIEIVKRYKASNDSSSPHKSISSGIGASSSSFLPLSRTSSRPFASPSRSTMPRSKTSSTSLSSRSPSSAPTATASSPLYKFPFRRSPKAPLGANANVPSPTKSIRSLKISNPTLISAPQIATVDLPLKSGRDRGELSEQSSSQTDEDSSSSSSPSQLSPLRTTSVLGNGQSITESTSTSGPILHSLPPASASSSNEYTLPTPSQLACAASLSLVTESGVRLSLGSLFRLPWSTPANHESNTNPPSTVILVFIRHFWCPLDQDYIQDIVHLVKSKKDEMKDQDVDLVIVSNGSHALIPKYRQIFGMPDWVKVYTDPTLLVYEAFGLGMIGEACSNVTKKENRKTGVGANGNGNGNGNEAQDPVNSMEGLYGKRGLFGGIATVVMRALKVGMPVWEKGGETRQLGGEFVFKEGMACTYAHRMQTARDHAPIVELFEAAGILPSSCLAVVGSRFPPATSCPDVQHEPSSHPGLSTSTSVPHTRATTTSGRWLGHPYAHPDHSFKEPLSTSPFTHVRRRTESLTSAETRTKARKARVRASTIWSVDVKEYSVEDVDEKGFIDASKSQEVENERWRRNLIHLREANSRKEVARSEGKEKEAHDALGEVVSRWEEEDVEPRSSEENAEARSESERVEVYSAEEDSDSPGDPSFAPVVEEETAERGDGEGDLSADYNERSLTSKTTHDHDTTQLFELTKELLMKRARTSNSESFMGHAPVSEAGELAVGDPF